MDLEFNDDQRLLKEMINRFAADFGGLEAHRESIRAESGSSVDTWRGMAELGLAAVLLPTAAGGLGGGGPELMIVGEAIGRHLLTVPFLETAVIGGTILSGAPEGLRDDELAALTDGTRRFALIGGEIKDEGGALTGTARGVLDGGSAERLIVDAKGALYLVDSQAPGVTREAYPLHGGGTAADVRLDDVHGEVIASGQNAADLLACAHDRRIAFLAAEALGAAEGASEATVEYLKTRVQFGTPLAANQALQHRAAEMLVEIEQLRSAVFLAACSLDEPDGAERARIMAAVSIVAAKAARFVAQQSVQLHGGIGVTEEHAVGHWFLRLTAIGVLLDPAANIRTLSTHGGFVAATPYWETAA